MQHREIEDIYRFQEGRRWVHTGTEAATVNTVARTSKLVSFIVVDGMVFVNWIWLGWRNRAEFLSEREGEWTKVKFKGTGHPVTHARHSSWTKHSRRGQSRGCMSKGESPGGPAGCRYAMWLNKPNRSCLSFTSNRHYWNYKQSDYWTRRIHFKNVVSSATGQNLRGYPAGSYGPRHGDHCRFTSATVLVQMHHRSLWKKECLWLLWCWWQWVGCRGQSWNKAWKTQRWASGTILSAIWLLEPSFVPGTRTMRSMSRLCVICFYFLWGLGLLGLLGLSGLALFLFATGFWLGRWRRGGGRVGEGIVFPGIRD